MSWKLKQWFRKAMPLMIVGLVLYSGYSLYRHGLFRRGLGPALSSSLAHVPVLGSHFRHFHFGSHSYAYRGRYRSHGFSRHHRHHRRRGHHRRHRRR